MRALGIVGRLALSVAALLGLLVLGAGAAVAGFVGSDDTVFNDPSALGDGGRPILTAPDLLAYDDITVTLRASAPGGVFIGTAHPVDVADFVGDSSRLRLTSVTRTGVVAEDAGRGAPVQPASADFWTRSMSGEGTAELTLDRATSAAQWVIAPRSGAGPTTVSFGVTVDGLHRAALAAAAFGAVLLVVCVELLLRARRRRRRARRPSAAERIAAHVPPGGPPRPPTSRGKRAAFSVALALVLTGCDVQDLVPAQRQSADLASTKVALTRAELPALLESYDARVRAAVRAARPPGYDTAKWDDADRGPALESDLFGTRVTRLTRLGRRSAPTHRGIEAFAGRFDAYPMWSLVASRSGRETRVDLFTKASVEAVWLRHAGTGVEAGLPAPGDPGPVPEADRAAGAIAAWRDYLRTGERSDRLELDTTSRQWRDNIADLGGRAMFRGFEVSAEPELTRVVSVADGALALVALRLTTRLDGRPDLAVGWAPPYARYRPARGSRLSFADIAVGVVHLPAQGTPTLLGSTFSEVGVKG